MPYYRVFFKNAYIGSSYEFIHSDDSIQHFKVEDYFDEDDEVIEVRETTPEEAVAYESGRRQGWDDFQEYLSIESQMKKHNGHPSEFNLENIDTIEKFICGVCKEAKSSIDLSGSKIPIGSYGTLWDVCKGCSTE